MTAPRCAADIHEELLLATDKLQGLVEDYVELVRGLNRNEARAEALGRLEGALAQNRALLTAYVEQLDTEHAAREHAGAEDV